MRSQLRYAALGAVVSLTLTTLAVAKLDTWKQETAAAFTKGQRDKVVLADSGKIRLSRVLKPLPSLSAARVWDVVQASDGSMFAATGDTGQVYLRLKDGGWTLLYDSTDSQALSLVRVPNGHFYVGTGPNGQVVDLTDLKQPNSRPDPSVQYIWDLAADKDGNLYAATGPAGGLWKRSPDGAWSQLLKSKHSHLLCLVVAPDGTVYAGSDGEGLIYRISPTGKVSILYDAGPSEIRCLLLGNDGTLYAGTAAEASSGGGPGRGASQNTVTLANSPVDAAKVNVAQLPEMPKTPNSTTSPGGTAAPKPITPGENAIYQIGPDGAAREIFRAKTLIYSLAWRGDRLLAGTGPEGILYEVDPQGHESSPIAKLDHGQVLSLFTTSDGDVLIGAGDPAAVFTLGPDFSAAGTFTSDVLDAKLPAQFGAVSWRADTPEGTSLALEVRTGNLAEPDDTWSEWSRPMTDPTTSDAQVPIGRFAQYRAQLKTTKADVSPELRSVVIRYKTTNLAPEITKLEVPDLTNGDGATRQTKLTLKWEASDPNGDELSYQLAVQKVGWPDWIKIGDQPISDTTYAWDTTALPAGIYRLKLTATDRLSNPLAMTRDRVSEPFTVDHQPPVVAISDALGVTITDELTRIVKAAYALDGGEWMPIFPDDGLFDRSKEVITLTFPDLKAGTHVLTVRATDAAGNLGSGDRVFTVK